MIPSKRVAVLTNDSVLGDLISKLLTSIEVNCFTSVSAMENSLVNSSLLLIIIDYSDQLLEHSKLVEFFKNSSTKGIGLCSPNEYSKIRSSAWDILEDIILKPFHANYLLLMVDRLIKGQHDIRKNNRLVSEFREYSQELEKNNAKVNIRNSRIENDLIMASNLQECLYPKELPVIPNVVMTSKSKSIERISGDFYYFEKYSSNRFSLIFADVSGHGVTAALFSAMVKSAISSINFEGSSPAEVIKKMNKFLIKSQKKPSYNYLTLCYAYIDLKKCKLTFCNAGLPAPILIQGDTLIKLNTNGPFVGIFDIAEYKQSTMNFSPGDKLIFFTDGVYENMEEFNIRKGYEKVVSIINEHKQNSADQILLKLYSLLEKNNSKNDDSTYLSVEYIEKQ